MNRSRIRIALFALAPTLACSPPSGAGEADTGASSSSEESSGAFPATTRDNTGSTSSSAPESSSESSGGESSSDGTSTGAPDGLCGDGVLDPLEQCDDGDLVGGDGCESDCRLSNLEPWSYLGDVYTEAHGLAVGPDGTVVVGGLWGNAWETGYYTPLLRTFAADGELLVETDALAAGDGSIAEVLQYPEGRFWLFGSQGSDGWIHRFDDRETEELSYPGFGGIDSASLGVEQIAIGSRSAVGMLDTDSTELLWRLEIGWVDDVALAANGDLLVIGQADFAAPSELRRFTPDGTEAGVPLLLAPLELCKLDSSALGIVVACVDDTIGENWGTQLRLYDDALSMAWSVALPDQQVFSVAASDDEILFAGAAYGSGNDYVVPAGFVFDADGNETSSFTPDPAEFGLTAGLLSSVERTPDGALVFSGQMIDLDSDTFPPAGYAYVARVEP